MPGLNRITPENYESMKWAVWGAEFPQLDRFFQLFIDEDIPEEQVISYGQKHRITDLLDTLKGIEVGALEPEALDEFRRPKKEQQ